MHVRPFYLTVHAPTDGRTDRGTDRQTDMVIPVYPPPLTLLRGGIIIVVLSELLKYKAFEWNPGIDWYMILLFNVRFWLCTSICTDGISGTINSTMYYSYSTCVFGRARPYVPTVFPVLLTARCIIHTQHAFLAVHVHMYRQYFRYY